MAKKKIKTKRSSPKKRSGPKKEISVMAWIENEWGEVLLVRQAAGLNLWTLPGGKVKSREALLTALEREVWEETKHKVKVDEFLDLMDRPERGAVMFLFRANTIKKGSNLRLPNREILDIRYAKKPPKSMTPSATYFWKRRKQGIYNWIPENPGTESQG